MKYLLFTYQMMGTLLGTWDLMRLTNEWMTEGELDLPLTPFQFDYEPIFNQKVYIGIIICSISDFTWVHIDPVEKGSTEPFALFCGERLVLEVKTPEHAA